MIRRMPNLNPQVDAYIARAQPFARPILQKLRDLFHKASPAIEEKLKWGVPSFEHKGIVGGFAAFKQHVNWGLWKASLLDDPTGAMRADASSPMSGGRIASVSDLPPDRVMLNLIRQAVDLNERGVKLPRLQRAKRPPLRTPADLAAALKANARAAATFKAFPPSHKRDYIEWITDAKQPATRTRRLEQAITWIAAGKPRNWKYMARK
jgi:uncharacterized protein YdeI (YjbR/CyaY-like superfamily)